MPAPACHTPPARSHSVCWLIDGEALAPVLAFDAHPVSTAIAKRISGRTRIAFPLWMNQRGARSEGDVPPGRGRQEPGNGRQTAPMRSHSVSWFIAGEAAGDAVE